MMKRKLFWPAFVVLALIGTRCGDDDDKPKTIPIVATHEATNIETNAATFHGEIVEDGNADVTATGFVYSSVVSEPTLADDKIELTDTEDDFSSAVSGLSSGTTYHVRAYATNSKGTGYGEVVDVPTGNAAPVATNISITGDAEVGKVLTATFTYTDAEGNPQGVSTYQWYVANDATGTGEAAIAGANALTYTLQEAQQDKYVRIGIIPKATAGSLTGAEVKSTFVGAIGEATTVTFNSITYGIINSATTGRKWLDRNLGAPNAPTSVSDFANYGSLYQWGRLSDGHEIINHTGPNASDMTGVNGQVNWEYSTVDVPGHSKFIISDGQPPVDWRVPQNNNLWQGVNGINNPCPPGWRIPTAAEWTAEGIVDSNDGYTKLKLTYTNGRYYIDGTFNLSSTGGYYWTTNIGTTEPTWAVRARFNSSGYTLADFPRAQGFACRCIKE